MQEDSRKGGLLEIGSRVSLCAQREARPYKYVSVEGPVIEIDHYDLDADLGAMAARYLGDSGRADYIERSREKFAQGNGIKVTIKPEAWLSADYSKS